MEKLKCPVCRKPDQLDNYLYVKPYTAFEAFPLILGEDGKITYDDDNECGDPAGHYDEDAFHVLHLLCGEEFELALLQ